MNIVMIIITYIQNNASPILNDNITAVYKILLVK